MSIADAGSLWSFEGLIFGTKVGIPMISMMALID
jgi:hypothetical protein